jgi:hypothetical protein
VAAASIVVQQLGTTGTASTRQITEALESYLRGGLAKSDISRKNF